MPIATASLTGVPYEASPVNAEIWYTLNSASASFFSDYKYILDVWEVSKTTGLTTSKIARLKFPPRPVNYRGHISVNKAVKPFIINNDANTIIPGDEDITPLDNQFAIWTANFGFEYNPQIEYLDITNSPAFGFATTNDEGFQVGDIITINKTNNAVNSQYNGTKIIGSVSAGAISIPGFPDPVYWYGIDGVFGQSTPVYYDGGLITNILRVSGTSSTRFAWNGTRQYSENNLDFTTDYLFDNTAGQKKWLTNYDNYIGSYNKSIGPNEVETINFLNKVGGTFTLKLQTFNGTTPVANELLNFTLNSRDKYMQFPIGTYNLMEAFSDPTLFNGVDRYRISFYESGGGGTQKFELIFRNIVEPCLLYENVRIVFLNRMGGYDYFTFNKDKKRTVAINRTEYKQVLDIAYEFGDRGDVVLAQDVQYTFTLNSDWISEETYLWLEELVTSPEVYIVTLLDSKYKLDPIVITDTSYVIKTRLRDRIFNLTLNYKLAYPVNVANL